MFKKLMIFLISVICFFICVVCVYAQETLTITTYYPSPYGSYNKLLTNSLGVGDNNNSGSLDNGDVPTTPGDVWIKGNVSVGTTASGGVKLMVDGRNAIPTTGIIRGLNRADDGTGVRGDANGNGNTIGVYGMGLQGVYGLGNYIGVFGANGGVHIPTGMGVKGESDYGYGGYFTSGGGGFALITGTGNVGIGTPNPQTKLDVNGNIRWFGRYGLQFTQNYLDLPTPYIEVWSQHNGGLWGINAWASSRKLKKNITDLEIDSNKIYKLHPVSFNWKTQKDGAPKAIGMIAEEVDEVLPELVGYDKDGNPHHVVYELLSVLELKELMKLQKDLYLTDSGELKIVGKDNDSYELRRKDNSVVSRISSFAEVVSAKIRAGLIETKKLIVDGVDILKRLNELSNKVDTQQKQIDELKKEIGGLKNK